MSKQDRLTLVEEGLATIGEAMQFTRLSRSDIYARMDRRELAYVKLGRRRMIPRKALAELAEKGLVAPAAAK